MGSAFHQLCPRYSGTLTPTTPTANRLEKTFTFTYTFLWTFGDKRFLENNILVGQTSEKVYE